MKSSKLSIKFRITFWYTLVFSLILALVFFYIYFLSKSYSVHDFQEELKDESADILENLYDKSSRNDILYNADWTKFCAGAKSKNYDSQTGQNSMTIMFLSVYMTKTVLL